MACEQEHDVDLPHRKISNVPVKPLPYLVQEALLVHVFSVQGLMHNELFRLRTGLVQIYRAQLQRVFMPCNILHGDSCCPYDYRIEHQEYRERILCRPRRQ